MSIGAEKMVELKGHYGIITKRVIKEWTGSEQGDWEWTSGVIIDAAASGSELELEVVEGDYWIHIVGWDGDSDASKSFTTINDSGRYVATSDCVFYYNFNSDATDACGTSGGGTLSLTGGISTGSGGKMGNGLLPDGSGYATGSLGGIDISNAWSFETWFKPTITNQGILFYIGDAGDANGESQLMIQLDDEEIKIEYDDADPFSARWSSTGENLDLTSKWYHLAVTYDGSNDMYVFVNGEEIGTDVNMVIDSNVGGSSPSIYVGGHPETPFGSADFSGAMDDMRFLNYERQAFAGGLMIAKVVPSTNTITLYNAGGGEYKMQGIEIWTGGSRCGTEISGGTTLTAGDGTLGGTDTVTTTTCTIGADDAVRLVDVDADNENTFDSGGNGDKEWVIDGVCWNDDGGNSGTIDSDCDQTSDAMIEAGIWGEDTAVDGSGHGAGLEFQLISSGNNDGAVSDWEAIPEFGTLLMPVASVLLIVGYNYRRKNNLEA